MMIFDFILDAIHDFLFAPKPRERLLVAHPSLAILLIIAYILICLHYGPAYMKNRKPYNIKLLIILYDIFQVMLNGYLFIKLSPLNFVPEWDFHCPKDWTVVVKRIEKDQDLTLWHLYLSKFLDFLDTIFFILRKKQDHVSFLHVLHHVSVTTGACYLLSIDNSPTYFVVIITLNTGVHMVMYAYYGLVTLGVKFVRGYKKAITTIQIVQFIMALTYMTVLCASGCFKLDVPRIIMLMLTIMMLGMFLQFYRSNFRPIKQRTK